MKQFLIFILLTATLTAYNQNKSRHLTEEEIILNTKTGDLYGSLVIPKKAKSEMPVVLIIAGSGPTDRDGNNVLMKNNSLKMLAEGLAKKKIASFRYDKRGVGKSKDVDINEADITFNNFVDDAEGWINKLKSDDRFSEIIVAGHSEGSLIGMIASEKSKANKYISIAGAGYNIGIVLKEQLKNQPDELKTESYNIIDNLLEGNKVDSVNPKLASLFRKSIQPYLIAWMNYDPKIEIGKLKIPVLILQGTTDIQISVDDAKRLKEGNPEAQFHILENMNHVLKEASDDYTENIKTYYNPDLPLKSGLIDMISDFITPK